MKYMTSNEIRQAFLDFFNEVNHEIVASAPLPNYDNPTLLFTNAGMNQFAEVFLGNDKRPYNRATTAQKVMRVSGKHNDLENVGPSLRHHTFFEMLGNFSFGDYFKKEAIEYAWKFLTGVIGLDPERLWASIYLDDDEAFELWQKWLPAHKIRRYGKEDNYWEMGDIGPNGPCSELHYYTGDLDNINPELLNSDDDVEEQFLEVWNLVFMQFETDANGVKTALPKPSIDTGMGLERVVRIVQNAANNYETDLFSHALDRTQVLLGDSDAQRIEKNIGYRVIADHGRAATFLISDGLIPGNSGAPYVLRMIIRRAARFGRNLGFTKPFLAEIAQVYANQMGGAYPAVRQRIDFIKRTLTAEEERFARTLDKAELQFKQIAAQLQAEGGTEISGEVAFDLYATLGLPLEITRDLAKEIGLSVNEPGFLEAKKAHAIASGAGAFGEYDLSEQVYTDALQQLIKNGTLEETGVDYDPYGSASDVATLVGIFQDGEIVDSVGVGESAELITTSTVFYVESGGEVSDSGTISTASGTANVTGMLKKGGLILHTVKVADGSLTVGDEATLQVDDARRANIRRNHSATHILHEELRRKLGSHVTQQGSMVAPDRLRFDFSHNESVKSAELAEIEQKINAAILANHGVTTEYMPKDNAIEMGAMALFGEKYGDVVRTVQMGERGGYSFELCGGLHVSSTGEIGSFHFTSEGSAAAGVRRIEAVTGPAAQAYVAEKLSTLDKAARKLNATSNDIADKIDALLADNKRLQKELEQLRRGSAKARFEELLGTAQEIGGATVMVGQVDGATVDGLREMTDWFKNRVEAGVVVISAENKGKPLFVAAVTKNLIGKGVKAGDIVRQMGKMTGGGGGGAPHLAQAGGRDLSKVAEALASVHAFVESKLG
ncbi:MAG: alanine--tRNA ligase [Candidatus Promineifilaceae bacterium]